MPGTGGELLPEELGRPSWRPFGPEAILWEWPRPTPSVTRLLWYVYRVWTGDPPPPLIDFILGQCSVVGCLAPGTEWAVLEEVGERLAAWLSEKAARAAQEVLESRAWEIPVVYDGPDLQEVARATGLSADEVRSIHAEREYRVGWMGFLPGFAYLVTLDERLRLPRRPSSRPRMEAGAVAIAEEMALDWPHQSTAFAEPLRRGRGGGVGAGPRRPRALRPRPCLSGLRSAAF